MRKFGLILVVASSCCAPAIGQSYRVTPIAPASAARGYGDVHLSKAAIDGEQIRVWWATLLNPDCTAAGTMTTQVAEPPRHGGVTISDEPFYPSYATDNPRSACDTHKAPGKQAFYTAAAGFHGHDRLVLQNATSEGRIRKIVVDLDVR